MKKNYFLLILSLIVSFTVLAQNSREKRERNDSFSKQLKHRKFNRINKGKTFSNFHINNKQKSSLKYQAEKNKNTLKDLSLKSTQSNIKQRLDSVIYKDWDIITNQWRGDDNAKTEYVYDNKGNLIKEFEFDWNPTTNQWELDDWKGEYTYDSNENLIQEIYYEERNETTNQWNYIWKYDWTYNINNYVVQVISSDWNSSTSQWVIDFKYEYTYDTNDNITLIVKYDLGQSTNQWVIHGKEEYSYDPNGNLIQFIEYGWNSTTNQWYHEYSDKEEYSYDANGNLIQVIRYNWNSTVNQFEYSYKDEIIYDSNGNVIQKFDYYWRDTTWVSEDKDEYIYDNNYSFSDLIIPFYLTEYTYDYGFSFILFNHQLKTINEYEWNETSNEWINEELGEFYYSEQNTLSVSEIDNSEFNIYPNPVINTLTINTKLPITKVGIYSILGQKVKEIDANFNSISTHDLSNGIYLLRIESENGNAIKKLVKQ